MTKNYELVAKEDALEGLRDTEFDAEKNQLMNLFFIQNRITSLGMLERIARDMNTLTED